MKKINFWACLFAAVLFSCGTFTACTPEEEEDPNEVVTPEDPQDDEEDEEDEEEVDGTTTDDTQDDSAEENNDDNTQEDPADDTTTENPADGTTTEDPSDDEEGDEDPITVAGVTFELVSKTALDATITITAEVEGEYYYYINDADSYDASYFVETSINETLENETLSIEDVWTIGPSGYTFNLSDEDTVKSGTTYIVALLAAGKDSYTTDDLIEYSVTIPSVSLNGKAGLSISDVDATTSSVSATITPGSDVIAYYVAYLTSSNSSAYSSDALLFNYLQSYATALDPASYASYTLTVSYLSAGTTGCYICAAAIDADGNATVMKVSADTQDYSYNSTTLTVSAKSAAATSATISLSADGDIAYYRYLNIRVSKWNNSYIYSAYGKDESKTQNALVENNTDNTIGTTITINTIPASDVADGTLKLSDLETGESYYFFVVGIASDGTFTQMAKASYTVGSDTDYIRSTMDGYSARELTLDSSCLEYMEDNTWSSNSISSGTLCYVRVYVDFPEWCSQVVVYIADAEYISATAWLAKTQQVIAKGTAFSSSGYVTSRNLYVNSTTTVFYSWQDVDGSWYESKELSVVVTGSDASGRDDDE